MSDLPAQHQEHQPGHQQEMSPQPVTDGSARPSCGKLAGKAALITGGDSGIGRAIAVAFAKEGADIVIVYLNEHEDAKETQRLVEAEGRSCVVVAGDVADDSFCHSAVETAVSEFGHLDVLVNNAGEQHPQENLQDISKDQLLRTFQTNIFAQFYMTQAALGHMRDGAAIINTASVTAYQGAPTLIDYSSTKGAIVSFTRALSNNLVKKKIRVNAVAPGPIWTPLIPASFEADKVSSFGKDVPMGRPGQPEEVAPCYVFLASDDSSYMSGQVLHPDGGTVVNG